ncbi:MAG: hypothetical protein V2I74_13335 [Erythrobacter sp.]|jgi:hypothetical protein|nr:hypothetical protein [Erythrobacter sp.]
MMETDMELLPRNARIRLLLGIMTLAAAGFGFGTAASRIATALGF